MSESERDDVAVIIHEHIWGSEYPSDEANCCADALLVSDWMTSHDERIRADERKRLLGTSSLSALSVQAASSSFLRRPMIDIDEE